METSQHLMLEIVNCQTFWDYQCKNALGGDCNKILRSQDQDKYKCHIPTLKRHIPNPWQGDIESSPILFISSNPSPGKEECGSIEWRNNNKSDENKIYDFFTNNIKRSPPIFRFTKSIQRRAAEILNIKPEDVIPGKHYTLTEVVHCNSNNQAGVNHAIEICTQKYLWRILQLTAASVIVLVGKFSWGVFNREPYLVQLTPCTKNTYKVGHFWKLRLGESEKIIINLPAPGSNLKLNLDYWLTPEEKGIVFSTIEQR